VTRHHSDTSEFILEFSLKIVVPDPDVVIFAASENHLEVGANVYADNNILVTGIKLYLTSFKLQKF